MAEEGEPEQEGDTETVSRVTRQGVWVALC